MYHDIWMVFIEFLSQITTLSNRKTMGESLLYRIDDPSNPNSLIY